MRTAIALARGATPVRPAFSGTGYSVPAGSLDRWFAARAAAAAQLVETVWRGDSTWAGQTLGLDGPTAHYSPITRIRARLQAASFTDGGHGWNNATNDTPAVSGDTVSGITAQSGFALIGDSFSFFAELVRSATSGDSVTFSGYGTHIRIHYRKFTAPAGPFTYSIDGGTAVTVTPATPVGGTTDFDFVNIAGLTNGLHTVTIVNTTSQDCEVGCDFIRSVGVVLHNQSARGGGSTGGSAISALQYENQLGLQTSTTVTDASTRPLDTRTGVRRPCLFVHGLGINDQQGNGGTDTSATLKANTIAAGNAARAAGADFLIVIPGLEAGNQSQLSPNYRQALKDAATALAAPWVDIGMGGALPTLTAGSTDNNPHLTAAQYSTQGDFIWDNVLGVV